MADTEVIWLSNKTLSPAERALLLRILFGPQARRRTNFRIPDDMSDTRVTLGVQTNAPAAAATAPGLAD